MYPQDPSDVVVEHIHAHIPKIFSDVGLFFTENTVQKSQINYQQRKDGEDRESVFTQFFDV